MARDDRKAHPDASRDGANGADIDPAIDALFQGPLAEFVNERNRLARDLRGRDRDAAERVRTLAKPSVSAWAVNQAYWHARPQFSAMLDAGEAVRALQQRVMRGEPVEGLAAASARLHEAVVPVARAAQEALEQDGHSATPQLMRRVLTTLHALAAHGRAATAPPAGRLSADVDAPGFDLLTALAPAHAPPRRTEPAPTPAPSHRRETRSDTRFKVTPKPTSDTEPKPEPAQPTPARSAHRSARSAHRPAAAPRSRQDAQARHAARARVSAAKAALVARQRALASAERSESTAAERLESAEAAVAAARAALDRATMARDRAAQTHEQAQAEASDERAAFVAAQDELDSAENQLRALARDPSPDGQDPD